MFKSVFGYWTFWTLDISCFFWIGLFLSFFLDWIHTARRWRKSSLVSCFVFIIYDDIRRLVTDVGCLVFFIESVVCCCLCCRPPCLLGDCINDRPQIACILIVCCCVGFIVCVGGVGYMAVCLYGRPTSLNVKEQQVMISPWRCPWC